MVSLRLSTSGVELTSAQAQMPHPVDREFSCSLSLILLLTCTGERSLMNRLAACVSVLRQDFGSVQNDLLTVSTGRVTRSSQTVYAAEHSPMSAAFVLRIMLPLRVGVSSR